MVHAALHAYRVVMGKLRNHVLLHVCGNLPKTPQGPGGTRLNFSQTARTKQREQQTTRDTAPTNEHGTRHGRAGSQGQVTSRAR